MRSPPDGAAKPKPQKTKMTHSIDFAELYPDSSMNWTDEFLHQVDNALAQASKDALTACAYTYLATLETAADPARLPQPDHLAPVWTRLDASGWYFSSEEMPDCFHLLNVPGTNKVLDLIYTRTREGLAAGQDLKHALETAAAAANAEILRRCSEWRMADVLPREQLLRWRTQARNLLMTATLDDEYPEPANRCDEARWESLQRRTNALNIFCQLTPDLAADPYRVELYTEDGTTTDDHAAAVFGVIHTTPETDAKLDRDTYADLLRLLGGSGVDTALTEFHEGDTTRTAFSFPVNWVA